ncbi:MAG TPA: hypothetical protein VHJ78_09695 [Actinomycetota bacterium]|nr:hypothetical protein [Actinomycetota bacterium]
MAETDPNIVQALATMAAGDPTAASLAGTALTWVTGGGGAGRITQERVQRFLWYDLPIKLRPTPEGRAAITNALATVLDLLELSRYAEICRSETTQKVHAAYSENPQVGLYAFREANLASGIYPPDLPEFKWGAAMGIEEARALSWVQDYLELAIASGELVPGAPDWKRKQRKLVRTYLNTPNFQLYGQTPLDVMNTERIQNWIKVEPSETRMKLLSDLANRLLYPAELPEGTTDPYPPLTEMLKALEAGETVAEDKGRLLEIAARMGLTRKLKGRLVLTKSGTAFLQDPVSNWRTFPRTLVAGNPYHRLAAEVMFAVLVDKDSTLAEVISTIRQAATEANYREAGTGLPPSEASLMKALDPTVLPIGEMGLFEPDDFNVKMALTPVGKSVALEALRHRATGPGATPWE